MMTLNHSCFIFDFDGTIARTHPGILASATYALEKLGAPVPGEEAMMQFVGPPLYASFTELCGLSDVDALRAIELYRERYASVGLFESEIYPGIATLLRSLKQRGVWVAIATGKPQLYVEQIIEHFGLTSYFDRIVGITMDNHSADKRETILAALPDGTDRNCVCMIGDRCFDIDAARELGICAVAVGYGYGSSEEFARSGADFVAPNVAALTQRLLGGAPVARGKMITFEGTDGCGKSTQLKLAAEWLTKRGWEVVTSREPGGCPISERIRELILSLDSTGMSAECEALLYAAGRIEHVREVLLPALKSGKIVLCDRFLDSSIAYQAYGRELGEDFIRLINRTASDAVAPDCTLQFDIQRETAKARMAQGAPLDRLEVEHEDFFARVARGYERLIAAEPERFHRIDSGRSIEEVFEDVANVLQREMENC